MPFSSRIGKTETLPAKPNVTAATSGAGIAYPSRAPEFTPGF